MKERILGKKTAEEAVRAFESRKARADQRNDDEPDNAVNNIRLNELWKRLQDCLSKADAAHAVKNQDENRKRFHDFCEKK